jgi:hypothetical protein
LSELAAPPNAPTAGAIPPLEEVAELYRLGHNIEPLERDGVDDFVDPISQRLHYRFFRHGGVTPFGAGTETYRTVDAWCLSDAAMLAYVAPELALESESACEAAGARATEAIRPSLARLFAELALGAPKPERRALEVHTLVRVSVQEDVAVPLSCYVADDGVTGIVAFRGTLPSSLANWIADCRVDLQRVEAPPSEAAVHAGFWRAALTLLEDNGALPGLTTYLDERRRLSPGLTLWFTGHSLGGALATIAGYRLRDTGALYTFGSPRVGNVAFAYAFSSRRLPHHRVVHRHDIIPCLPTPLPLITYEHTGALRYIAAGAGAPPSGLVNVRADVATPSPVVSELPSEAAAPNGAGASAAASDYVAGFWHRLRESVTHFQSVHVADWLGRVVDHAPLFYSRVLWSDLLRERGAPARSGTS